MKKNGLTIKTTPLLVLSLILVTLGSFDLVSKNITSIAKMSAIIILCIYIGLTLISQIFLFFAITKPLKITKNAVNPQTSVDEVKKTHWGKVLIGFELMVIISLSFSPTILEYISIPVLLMIKWVLSLIQIQLLKRFKEKVSQIQTNNF